MNLSEMDLSDINIDTIGDWPLKIRIGIMLASTIIFFALGYYWIATHQSQEYAAEQQKTKTLKATYQTKFKKVAALDQYRAQNKILEKRLATHLEAFSEQNSLSSLLEMLSKEAARAKLTYRAIRPLEITTGLFYMEQAVELSLVGDYHRFGHFVANISKAAEFVTLHDFVIHKREGAVRDPLMMEVVVKTYWQKPKIPAKAS